MSFQPVVPLGGLGGWRFLQRTLPEQEATFAKAPTLSRDAAYFRDNIADVTSAEALVGDRRMLSVALGAFGLSGDIDKTAFIRTALEESSFEPDSLVNRLTDPRYREMARAFGFGDVDPPNTSLSDFPDRILGDWKAERFETALGRDSPTMARALNAERALPELAARDLSEEGKWLGVLGDRQLREVVEGALGLPDSFAALDLDRQVDILQTRTSARYGTDSLTGLAADGPRDELVSDYVVRAGAAQSASATTRGQAALTLLSGAASPTLLSGADPLTLSV